MPMKSEDVLQKLVEATQDAKDATRALHEASQEYRSTVNRAQADLADQIKFAVERAVDGIRVKAREDMNEAVHEAVDEIAKGIKEKLGLQ